MSLSRRHQRAARRVSGSNTSSNIILRIACGQSTSISGPDQPVWSADTGYNSGTSTVSVTNAIDTSGVSPAAPVSIYQNERWITGTLTYTFSNVTPNAAYALRLHFAEVYYTSSGTRVLNIATNGVNRRTGFDVFTAAGGMNKAVAIQVPATADSTGSITLSITATAGEPKLCGIELSGNVAKDDTPTNLSASPSSSYVTLTWSAPTFPTGSISGYNVYQNGSKINTSLITVTNFKPGQNSAALTANTQYTFNVRSVIGGSEKLPGASRTVTTTNVSTGVTGKTVAIIGDSLTAHYLWYDGPEDGPVRVPAALKNVGWQDVWMWARSGKFIATPPDYDNKTTMENIADCRAELGREPDLWIIALGSNDVFNPDKVPDGIGYSMQQVFDTLGSNAKVMWVNLRVSYPDGGMNAGNVIINDKISARPRSRVADWYTYVGGISDPSIWNDDQVHMSSDGYTVRDNFVAQESVKVYNALS